MVHQVCHELSNNVHHLLLRCGWYQWEIAQYFIVSELILKVSGSFFHTNPLPTTHSQIYAICLFLCHTYMSLSLLLLDIIWCNLYATALSPPWDPIDIHIFLNTSTQLIQRTSWIGNNSFWFSYILLEWIFTWHTQKIISFTRCSWWFKSVW